MFEPVLRYVRQVQRCPCLFLVLYVCAVVLGIGLAWRPVQLQTDLSSFVQADGEAARFRGAYLAANDKRKELDTGVRSSSRRLGGMPQWYQKTINVVYAARGGDMLDLRAQIEARSFERKLRALPGWQDFCLQRSTSDYPQWMCDPGKSLVAYAWPSQAPRAAEGHMFELSFTGGGSEPLPLPAVFQYLRDVLASGQSRGDLSLYLPTAYDANAYPDGPPAVLRSSFTFSVIYGSLDLPAAQLRAQYKQSQQEYTDFVTQQVYPLLRSGTTECKYIDIYYSGDGIDAYEVSNALETDILWALGSLGFVTLYMAFQARNLLVTASCFFSVFASVPLAYVCTPAAGTTFASLMSLFLITVIDIDIVFIFLDFWTQSVHMGKADERLAWTVLRAGRCCMATSLTTSLSFFANLQSAMQPLREFGMFMGLCVTNVFVLAVFVLPPVIIIRHEREQRRQLHSVVASEGTVDSGAPAMEDGGLPELGDAPEAPCPKGAAVSPQWHLATNGPRDEPGLRGRLIQHGLCRLVDLAAGCPLCIFCASLLCVVGFCVCVGLVAKLDTGMPEIFPPSHNQVRGKALAGLFVAVPDLSWEQPPSLSASVCRADDMTLAGTLAGAATNSMALTVGARSSRACILEWCESISQGDDNGTRWPSDTGTCWRGPTIRSSGQNGDDIWSTAGCRQVLLRARVAALDAVVTSGAWASAWLPKTLAKLNATAVVPKVASDLGIEALKSLVLEDWETGSVSLSSFYTANAIQVQVNQTGADGCEIHTMCFLGPARCQLDGWQSLGRLDIIGHPVASTATASARGLNLVVPTVADNKQIVVEVVWGIWSPSSTPLVGPTPVPWQFDPSFQPENPWAQRAQKAMCIDVTEELRVVTADCWVVQFQTWLQAKGQQFPSRTFHDDIRGWYLSNEDTAKQRLWMIDGTLKAAVLQFRIDVSTTVNVYRALTYKARWDGYVAEHNKAASICANRAAQTSAVWVRAEAQVAIIDSTLHTILLECALGGCGVLVFTGDPVLALLVLGFIVSNMAGLAFFMTTVMNWKIGPIEIIFLVVFLGYSVTFGLHMALNYSQVGQHDQQMLEMEAWARRLSACRGASCRPAVAADEADEEQAGDPGAAADQGAIKEIPEGRLLRKARARLAVVRVGGAILSTTVSTIGSSVFLLFCSLEIFKRLGRVVIAVTLLSLISTVLVMPAVLILMGPSASPWYKRVPCEVVLALRTRLQRAPKGTSDVPLLD